MTLGDGLEKFGDLESRVYRMVELFKATKARKEALEAEVRRLRSEMERFSSENERLKSEVSEFEKDRELIKEKVERMLGSLDGWKI
jgi:chromosome segregation ATPase